MAPHKGPREDTGKRHSGLGLRMMTVKNPDLQITTMMLLVLCVMCYGDLLLLMLRARLGWSEFFQATWETRDFYASHCVRKKAESCRPLSRVTRDGKRDPDQIALYYHLTSTAFGSLLCFAL